MAHIINLDSMDVLSQLYCSTTFDDAIQALVGSGMPWWRSCEQFCCGIRNLTICTKFLCEHNGTTTNLDF